MKEAGEGRRGWLREKERQMQQDREMDGVRAAKTDRKRGVSERRLWARRERRLLCSPLRHLRNNWAYESPINELSQGPVLKGFIWLWSSFVYSISHPSDSQGIRTLSHLNRISLCHFLISSLCGRDSPSAIDIHLAFMCHFLFYFLSFRVKMCIRLIKTCPRKTLLRCCWGRANWRRPKPKDKLRFRPQRVSMYKGHASTWAFSLDARDNWILCSIITPAFYTQAHFRIGNFCQLSFVGCRAAWVLPQSDFPHGWSHEICSNLLQA